MTRPPVLLAPVHRQMLEILTPMTSTTSSSAGWPCCSRGLPPDRRHRPCHRPKPCQRPAPRQRPDAAGRSRAGDERTRDDVHHRPGQAGDPAHNQRRRRLQRLGAAREDHHAPRRPERPLRPIRQISSATSRPPAEPRTMNTSGGYEPPPSAANSCRAKRLRRPSGCWPTPPGRAGRPHVADPRHGDRPLPRRAPHRRR